MAVVETVETELRARVSGLAADLRRAHAIWADHGAAVSSSLQRIAIGVTGVNQAVQLIARSSEAVRSFGAGFIAAAADVETLQNRLVGLLGSTTKAREEYARVQQLAATTPFDLRGVAEADVILKSFGDRSNATLKAVTDLAAFMGTNAVEAASAYGRAYAAGAGAADILRERGVLALIQLRTGIADLTKLTLPEFRKALYETMVDPMAGIAGSTDRLAKTWSGRISNIEDSTSKLKASIGSVVTDSDAAKSSLENISGLIDDMAGDTDKWVAANRKLIDQKLGELFGGIEKGVSAVPEKLEQIVSGFNAISNAWGTLPEPVQQLILLTAGIGGAAVVATATAGGAATAVGGSGLLAKLMAVVAAFSGGIVAGSELNKLGEFDVNSLNDLAARAAGRVPPIDQRIDARGIDDASNDAINNQGTARPIYDWKGMVIGVEPIDNNFAPAGAYRVGDDTPRTVIDEAAQRAAQKAARQARLAQLQASADLESARSELLDAEGYGGNEDAIRSAFEVRREQMERQHAAEMAHLRESADAATRTKQIEAERIRQRAQLIQLAREEASAVDQLRSSLESIARASAADLIARYENRPGGGIIGDIVSGVSSFFGGGSSVNPLVDPVTGMPHGFQGPPLPPDLGGPTYAAEQLLASMHANGTGYSSSYSSGASYLPSASFGAGGGGGVGTPRRLDGPIAYRRLEEFSRLNVPKFEGDELRSIGMNMFPERYPALLAAIGGAMGVAGEFLLRDPKSLRRSNPGSNLAGEQYGRQNRNVGINWAIESGTGVGLSDEDIRAMALRNAGGQVGELDQALPMLAGMRIRDLIDLQKGRGVKIEDAPGGGSWYNQSKASQAAINDRFQNDVREVVALFLGAAKAIDAASVSLSAFGDDGLITIERLKRAAADASEVIAGGIPNALSAAISSGNMQDAATVMASQFGDTFVSRLGERLLAEGPIAARLTEAVRLGTDAADALARGDMGAFRQLTAASQREFMAGQQDFLRTVGPVVGGARSFLGGINPSYLAGLIDQTGITANVPSIELPNVGAPSAAGAYGSSSSGIASTLMGTGDQVSSTLARIGDAIVSRLGEGQQIVVNVIEDGRTVASAEARARKLQRGGNVLPIEVTKKR